MDNCRMLYEGVMLVFLTWSIEGTVVRRAASWIQPSTKLCVILHVALDGVITVRLSQFLQCPSFNLANALPCYRKT